MSKRFSETDKWQDEWFSALEPFEKLTWLFICDKCDNAGFFEVNPRLNSFLIGISLTEYQGALKGLERGLIISDNGKKGFIKKFLYHQKNIPLNHANAAHRQIINLVMIQKSAFDESIDFQHILKGLGRGMEGALKGLTRPIGTGIGKGIGKKGGVGENENGQFPVKIYPDIHKAIEAEQEVYQVWRKGYETKPENYIKAAIEDVHLKNIQDSKSGLSAEMFLSAVSRNILNEWTPDDRKKKLNGQQNGIRDIDTPEYQEKILRSNAERLEKINQENKLPTFRAKKI